MTNKSANVQKSTLREAAQQALEALEAGPDVDPIFAGETEDALRAALVEDAMQKFTDVNQELEAALAEPDWQDLYLKEKKRADMWRDKYESVAGAEQRIHPLAEPVQEPVADRAAFERHAERLGYSVDPDTREGREGGYWSSHTQLMWLTWQAALAKPDERNFCPRCGKRTNDIHTCTPPENADVHS